MTVSHGPGSLLPIDKKVHLKMPPQPAVMEETDADEQFFSTAIVTWGVVCYCAGILMLPVSLPLMAVKYVFSFFKGRR